MEKKMTKMEAFAMLREVVVGSDHEYEDELIEFIDTQMAQLEAKAVKAKERAEKKQAVGDMLRERVLDTLTEEYQSTDQIMESIDLEGVEIDGGVTRAKISARLTQLVHAGRVEKESRKVEDGRKAMCYRLATLSNEFIDESEEE